MISEDNTSSYPLYYGILILIEIYHNMMLRMNGGKKVRYKSIIVLLISALVLVGCNGEQTEELMYEHMEESVNLESDFVEIGRASCRERVYIVAMTVVE